MSQNNRKLFSVPGQGVRMRPHASVVNYSRPQGSNVEEDQVEESPDPAPPPVIEKSPEEETVQPKRRRKTADDE